jgi:hypothetical protein
MKQDNKQKGEESEKIQTVECGANFLSFRVPT